MERIIRLLREYTPLDPLAVIEELRKEGFKEPVLLLSLGLAG